MINCIMKGVVTMQKLNKELVEYIETNIFPQYNDNDKGHGIVHIQYVINRALALSTQFENIDVNLLYTAASYHDIAHKIDKSNHEKLSALIFENDSFIQKIFNDVEINIIKEAIEDHRASLQHSPRSNYGKILSSADRSTDVNEFLSRTHAYTLKHFPNLTQEEIIRRGIEHAKTKYGKNGYAKHYLQDDEYNAFISEIRLLISDEKRFEERYKSINNLL